MAAIGDNDKLSALVHTDPTACVFFRRERTWNRADGLNQSEGCTATETVHVFVSSSGSRNFVEKLPVNRKDGNLDRIGRVRREVGRERGGEKKKRWGEIHNR